MTTVTIYRFKGYDIREGGMVLSPRWGTLEAIKARKCVPIKEPAVEVDESVVDTDEPGLSVPGYHPPEN